MHVERDREGSGNLGELWSALGGRGLRDRIEVLLVAANVGEAINGVG